MPMVDKAIPLVVTKLIDIELAAPEPPNVGIELLFNDEAELPSVPPTVTLRSPMTPELKLAVP
jgi:hypothetical protein